MEEIKQKIENFIDKIILENNYEIIDLIYIYVYSLKQFSWSRYQKYKDDFKKKFTEIAKRTLQKKYNLKVEKIKNLINYLIINFLKCIPDNILSTAQLYNFTSFLLEILKEKTSKLILTNINNRFENLDNLEKEILSFILNYIPLKIKELQEQENKYVEGFHIRENLYFEIGLEKWTYIFNQLYNKSLREYKFRKKVRNTFLELPEEYSFWELGDKLMKLGIGYYIPYFTNSGNFEIEFKIPNFIYEKIKHLKSEFQLIENFNEKIQNIEKERNIKKEFGEEFDLGEPINNLEVLESDIEKEIVSNPEIVEEGLEIIQNQYRTKIGIIDILCKDKNGNYVVIELKKGRGNDKVIGQLLRYLAWIEEHVAEKNKVRGIIVAKSYDEGLEYAIKGVKFQIDIKIFENEPPIGENIKYCDKCVSPNRKSANYCRKCGEIFWM
ncbi:MAG: endonuclease NucS domain-containing protein [Promethearchaeia archaeon]